MLHGVPRGTKLGPVAVLALINYFVSGTPKVSRYNYVDDMSLVQTYHNTDQTSSLIVCIPGLNKTHVIQSPKMSSHDFLLPKTPTCSAHFSNW